MEDISNVCVGMWSGPGPSHVNIKLLTVNPDLLQYHSLHSILTDSTRLFFIKVDKNETVEGHHREETTQNL